GSVAGLVGVDNVTLDVVEGDVLDVDLDIVGLGELLRGFLDGVGAFGVGPDDKSALVRAVVAAVVTAVATARGRHKRDCGDTCDRWSAAESHGVFLPGGLSEVVHAVHRRTRVRCGHAW